MMIGVDLAKNVLQLNGTSMTGHVAFRREADPGAVSQLLAKQPPRVVVFEACGSASYWAREMTKLGHAVKLIAPQYVRPFVKRQKNDAANAEAIVIAAQRVLDARRRANIRGPAGPRRVVSGPRAPGSPVP